jgi:hypothetical protein
MPVIRLPVLPVAFAGVLSCALGAHGQDVAGTPPSPSSPADALQFHLAPYIWLTSLSGDIGVRNIEFDATKSFVDILHASDTVFGLMGAVDLEAGPWVFEFNGAWTTAQISHTQGLLRNTSVGADVDINSAWFELFAGYRVVDTPFGIDHPADSSLALDFFGGGRVTAVGINATLRTSTSVTLPGGDTLAAARDREWDRSDDWVEPFVGSRLTLNLTDRWTITLRGDVGGFDVDNSHFSWQAAGLVGYHWKLEDGELSLFAGYRALAQDYETTNFSWNMTTHGPLLGMALNYTF